MVWPCLGHSVKEAIDIMLQITNDLEIINYNYFYYLNKFALVWFAWYHIGMSYVTLIWFYLYLDQKENQWNHTSLTFNPQG